MSAPSTSFRSYRDYLDLFENRLSALDHHDLLVFPDRAVGPSAEQALMDLRSNPRTSHHPWPSPGVYTTLRFAKSFAKVLDIMPELSKTALMERWLTLWPDRSLASIVEVWPRVDTLLAHSTSSALWFQVCADAAKSDDPEISDWMQALLTTMHWCLCCEEENLVGSRWHFLDRVSSAMPILTLKDWIVVTERNPWHMTEKPFVLHVPLLKAPFPSESRFFAGLEATSFLRVVYYQDLTPPSSVRDFADLPHHLSDERPDLFVITGKMRSLSYTLLESDLARWSLNLPAIAESPLKHDIAHLKFLKTNDSDSAEDIESKTRLREVYELLRAHRATVSSSDLLAAAEFSGLLSKNVAADGVHPKWSAEGVACVSIDDTWALPRQKICLVSGADDYRDLWDPLSKAQRSKAPIPFGLNHLITTNHVPVASSADEALWAQSFFETRHGDFSKWESPTTFAALPNSAPPSPSAGEWNINPRLSPSGIEALLRCPYQFYDQRLLRNQESAELDALTVNALKRGEWLHKSLEDFFARPDFSANAAPAIARSLGEHLEKYFAGISSPAYLMALRKHIPKFSEDLGLYIRDFETPLQSIWPERNHRQELSVSTTYAGLNLRGKIDRLDLIGDNQALLWDYKSGGNYHYGLKTLNGPTHRKVQWLLYTKMIEASMNLKIVGGGYVQLLNPQNSGIYFFADHLGPEKLQALQTSFATSEHAPKILNSKDLLDANAELDAALEQTRGVINSGLFERKPLKTNQCASCSSKVICGRPYFATEAESP